MASYLSTKVEARISKSAGMALFVKEKIHKDEVVVDYSKGLGKFVDSVEADRLYEKGFDHMIQIDDDLFFAATNKSEFEDADLLNHSCNPNCGLKDRFVIVAMRDILSGEEITSDYAMHESSQYEFICNCGSKNCRKKVSGNDWKIPELQRKYDGYFSDYINNKIKKTAPLLGRFLDWWI